MIERLKKYTVPLLFLIFAIAFPAIAQGQTLENPLVTSDIRVIIGRVIKALLGISGAVALLMFVWGGFQWLISGGSPDKIKKGKDTLLWAALGLVIIFTSYTIVTAVITAITSGTV